MQCPCQSIQHSRRLDLDLISFGNETRLTPTLTLPHPRAVERRFVLQPLSEIAPDLILPNQNKSVTQLLAKLTFVNRTVVKNAYAIAKCEK